MKKLFFLILYCLPLITNGQRATVPYSTDFDMQDTYWTLGYLSGNDAVSIMYGYLIFSEYFLEGPSIGYADLKMDMSGATNVLMDFRWQYDPILYYPGCWDTSYAVANSGVYFSNDDGVNFIKVYAFHEGTSGWQDVSLNISRFAAQHGMNLNDQIIVRFQSFIYYSVSPNCMRDTYVDFLDIYSDCPADENISFTISDVNAVFLASNTITANNEIANGADVYYGANTRVILNTGFEVNSGCTFKADLNGCSALKSGDCMDESITKKEVYDNLDIDIFPNPSSGVFYLNLNENELPVNLIVFDYVGKTILNKTIYSNQDILNLSSFGKGIYNIYLQSAKLNEKIKVLVQ